MLKRALEIAENDSYDPQCHYEDLKKCYPDFCVIIEQLKNSVEPVSVIFR